MVSYSSILIIIKYNQVSYLKISYHNRVQSDNMTILRSWNPKKRENVEEIVKEIIISLVTL